MAEELRYRISFTKGSLTGQLFPLGSEPVIVGRSHTCGIRVMEPDVSGRHVMLSVGAKGVGMEVISSRRTLLDGKLLKTGDQVPVKAGQTVAMGGIVAFVVECYRNDGDQTEAPGDWTNGMTRFGVDDSTRRPGAEPAQDATSMTTPVEDFGGQPGAIGDDDDTGTHIPAPPSRANRPPPRPARFVPPPVSGTTSTGTIGTLATTPSWPVPPSGGETLGTEALPPSADATQVIQTRAATPQEMAYMRELHNMKRRRKLGLRLGLGGVATAIAAGVCVWLAWQQPEPVPPIPKERKTWKLLDSEMRTIPDQNPAGAGDSVFLSYPAAGEWVSTKTAVRSNSALGTEETVFSVKTRVGSKLDLPLQLRVIAYANAASLNQSLEEAFADWDRTSGLGLEKQSHLAVDFVGVDPGIPCLRYTYTRKATQAEEQEGVLDWAGVLSFARLRDTCIVYLREVPSVEELRAEHMLARTAVFFGISAPIVRSRWMGRTPQEQAPGSLPILRNSAKELLGKNMDNEWEELETKLTTILIRTYPNRKSDPDAARLHDEALEWMGILRARQDETWKKRCVIRFQATRDKNADTKRMDEGIRALFRSKDDRRHVTAQKEKWWEQ
ncbi:MAG: FHA domain-containing protein [Kiritimatiellae bacterium]|nr:FHA domain-containing protein [Kiritimatiellia bacterium]